ncbi:amino acid-binding protein [Longimycelium tulufanense]|uniref:Amino acid-binding protein n=1 Tax=Longimycelium tulufanense TaxID=907463 RepID=A0A8J3CAA1_9PSEU|nr:ACT domain-containing protein [Longimycelium tulufanense]GGM38166.1 amino acid-binding protein [Longimycelium tulufanense]
MGLTLDLLPERYVIARFAPDEALPEGVWQAGGLVSVTRAPGELSVVCPETVTLEGARVEQGWRALAVRGPLDFALTGIMADLSGALADAGISLFAISTYDTDYVLVREQDLDGAVRALRGAGPSVEGI